MPRTPSSLLKFLLVSVTLPLVLYGILQASPIRTWMQPAPGFHFYVVSAAFIAAVVASSILGWSGIRARDVNVMMVFVALQSLAGSFLVHGLSTPGFIISRANQVPVVASQLGLTVCAVWMYLSSLPSDHPLIRRLTRRRRVFVAIALGVIAAVHVALLVDPTLAEFVPLNSVLAQGVVAVVTIGLYVWAMARYFRQFKMARFPVHAAVVVGDALLAITEFIMVTTMMWTLAWWLYHLVLIAAMVTLLYGILVQNKSNTTVKGTFQEILHAQSVHLLRVGISESVYNLILATERKDPYTAGHNVRVALFALQLARMMGVSREGMRALLRGGVVHDVGKLEVPDAILNKPGPLTPEERAIIEQHPVTGYDMCRYIGFMTEELAVIRHHHERWDGTGYPDGLSGTDIPLLARILAVADVYDALTSTRAYRAPWPHERALQVIAEGAGSQFDPACVEAWLQLCRTGDIAYIREVAAAMSPHGD
ncbi:HD-GYP domain-containing protein [Alicyclobacillus macrosporangiidus]|uniref:HDIG domain-containing protein n=1 Tax=Alicyclobacillus macrosporangiidus TaxID=392015 RepID=A0A1I7HF96_9BACL|nr:HD-GYP domain-containing protein [Alicyclobacillus macrosporangiidus]SFU59229.1 HDIG domain-containing protein [Alicyclobacillus macrosporangiidus]